MSDEQYWAAVQAAVDSVPRLTGERAQKIAALLLAGRASATAAAKKEAA